MVFEIYIWYKKGMCFEEIGLRNDQGELTLQFIPSNPWVAVGWRKLQEIEIPLAPIYRKRNINFIPTGAKRVLPEKNQVELIDGRILHYEYLILATGPALAYEEIEGLGPDGGFTQSICRTDRTQYSGLARQPKTGP